MAQFSLTGNISFRSLDNNLVLQVEYTYKEQWRKSRSEWGTREARAWRDATVADLLLLDFNTTLKVPKKTDTI
ncbi:hypothetical protein [Ralstonia phage RSP15]|uniref:hypothetical protein n=1 Tax=Ralstonia phage RSP15 TaxID=1785960 RepID=UPI00074D443B|nr:hypothetical protein BH754_gp155 [Ralstonia phage RSP15]BAU40151.1 hypothetical protein [Ralstonia phage RSP15]